MHPHHNLPSQIMKTKSMRSLLLRVITDYVKTSPKQSCPSNHHSCYKKKKHKQPLSQAHRRGPSADPPTFQRHGAMHQSASCKTDASGNITSKSCNYWTKHRNFGRARPRPTQHRRLRNPPCSQRKRRRGECATPIKIHARHQRGSCSGSHASPAAAAPPPP